MLDVVDGVYNKENQTMKSGLTNLNTELKELVIKDVDPFFIDV